ncbi:MAG TPA: hypothetical protein VNK04_17360 [Gemmataceae bacterium]|nr:hypothetical protein [Gemmataceae bacterium]
MWFSIKRRLARATGGRLEFLRGPCIRDVRCGYEKAGLTVLDEPVPWNAETVVIEARVEYPDEAPGSKGDFTLCMPGQGRWTAAALEPRERTGHYRVVFRLVPPPRPAVAWICWRSRPLDRIVIPYLTVEEFVAGLQLEAPTIFALLEGHSIPCRAVVADQVPDLMACALLKSPTSLLPVVDLNLTLEVAEPRGGHFQAFPVHLAASQIIARQALVSVRPAWRPGPLDGTWEVRWTVTGRVLGQSELRVLSPDAFQRSIYMTDARRRGGTRDADHRPAGGEQTAGFLLASREAGLAARCRVEVRVYFKDHCRPPETVQTEVLVTDVPFFAPSAVPVEDLQQISAIELFHHGEFLGAVSNCPMPTASFTSEGGFSAPEPFPWTAFAEVELEERLRRLMEVSPGEAA